MTFLVRIKIIIAVAVIAVISATGLWYYRSSATNGLIQPYAIWEAGKVAAIRNCDVTNNSENAVACMELNCRAAVAQQLPLVASATIGIGTIVDSIDIRYVRIVGPVEYAETPLSPRPNGYECDIEGLRPVRVRILHSR